VTPQTDQRQALITEIDSVLSKTQSRLPWVMAGEVSQQRRVLRRVREYLGSLPLSPTQRPAAKGQLPPSSRSTPASRRRLSLLGADLSQERQPILEPQNSANQQIVQAVVQDLRSSILIPLQEEIAALQNQREQMRQELQYLDQQRGKNAMSGQSQKMMTEFFQTLIDRCAQSLTQQVAQNLADLQVELLQYQSREPHDPILAADSSTDPALLTPQERLEQLRALQAQSDKLLKTLDASINVVFETLQSNLQSYSESMTQGVEHMYSLGQQGEVMFSALVNRLASQLGREASSYIQSRSEDSLGETLETPSGGKSLTPSAIAPETDRAAQNAQTSDPPDRPVVQPSDPQHLTESVELAQEVEEEEDSFEPESIDDENAEELEELVDLDEEIGLEFFEQFEEVEESVEIAAIEEDQIDRLSNEPSADADRLLEEEMEGDEFYDALFASDRFTTGEREDEGESDDPLQEFAEEAEVDEIAEEPEPELNVEAIAAPEEQGEQPVDEEAIAETLESDLFEGLGDVEAQTDKQQEPLAAEEIPETDLSSSSSVLESDLFEGAPAPSQVEDPVSLETFMELFGEEDSPPQIISESLETHWADEAPLNATEDLYISASPDEVLLPTEIQEAQEVSQLNLQGEVLEQLSQDLFSLEGEGTSPVPESVPEEQVTDLFGNLEPASPTISAPEEESLMNEEETPLNTENFLNEILTPPESGILAGEEEPEDRENSESGVRVDSLFEGFPEEQTFQESTPEEEAADLTGLWEDESSLNLPESLSIDTVFGEESENLDTEEPKSITVDNVFEKYNQGNKDAIDPSAGRSPKGTSTIENMFEGFLRGETVNVDESLPASSEPDGTTVEETLEETLTLNDVFEGFADDDDPEPPLNSLKKN